MALIKVGGLGLKQLAAYYTANSDFVLSRLIIPLAVWWDLGDLLPGGNEGGLDTIGISYRPLSERLPLMIIMLCFKMSTL